MLRSMLRAKCGGKEYPIQSTHWLVPYRELTRQGPVRICCWVPPQTAEPRRARWRLGAIWKRWPPCELKLHLAQNWNKKQNGVWSCSRLIQLSCLAELYIYLCDVIINSEAKSKKNKIMWWPDSHMCRTTIAKRDGFMLAGQANINTFDTYRRVVVL